jgi:hypothetical protein
MIASTPKSCVLLVGVMPKPCLVIQGVVLSNTGSSTGSHVLCLEVISVGASE